MQKSLVRKGLVFGIIVLFVGASVTSSINGNDDRITGVSYIEDASEEIPSLGDRDVLFEDDFNDNSKNYSKWSDSGDGTWYEQNQRTEIYLPIIDISIGHVVESIFIPATISSTQSVIVSLDMISYISGLSSYGEVGFTVSDGSNKINLHYFRNSDFCGLSYTGSGGYTDIGWRDDGSWSNQIEIYSDRFKADMDTFTSGWIYNPLFSSSNQIKVKMHGSTSENLGDWMFGFDNAMVLGESPSNNPPNNPSTPSGPTSLEIGESGTYETSAIDPDGDQVQYRFDWNASGGHDYSDWTSLDASGHTDSLSNSWGSADIYVVKTQARDEHNMVSDWSSGLTVTVSGPSNNPPNTPSTPSGPTFRETGEPGTYETSAIDPDGDQVQYRFDWNASGGHDYSDWTSLDASDHTDSLSNSWGSAGTYKVKAQARDEHVLESDWSSGLFVIVTESNNLPNSPSNPSPGDGATGVDINANLGWTCSDPDPDDTLTYDVKFGTSSPPPQVVTGQSGTNYDPGTMATGTKYYWQIVARDNHGAETSGPVWDFTTIGESQPVADAGGPYNGVFGGTIQLSGSATGGTPPYSYAWDIDNNGQYDDETGQNPTINVDDYWVTPGVYNIGLHISDSSKNIDVDFAVATIGSNLINADFSWSTYPSNPKEDEPVTLYSTSNSDNDIIKYRWGILGIFHNRLGWRYIEGETFEYVFEEDYTYIVRLIIEDNQGNVDEKIKFVNVDRCERWAVLVCPDPQDDDLDWAPAVFDDIYNMLRSHGWRRQNIKKCYDKKIYDEHFQDNILGGWLQDKEESSDKVLCWYAAHGQSIFGFGDWMYFPSFLEGLYYYEIDDEYDALDTNDITHISHSCHAEAGADDIKGSGRVNMFLCEGNEVGYGSIWSEKLNEGFNRWGDYPWFGGNNDGMVSSEEAFRYSMYFKDEYWGTACADDPWWCDPWKDAYTPKWGDYYPSTSDNDDDLLMTNLYEGKIDQIQIDDDTNGISYHYAQSFIPETKYITGVILKTKYSPYYGPNYEHFSIRGEDSNYQGMPSDFRLRKIYYNQIDTIELGDYYYHSISFPPIEVENPGEELFFIVCDMSFGWSGSLENMYSNGQALIKIGGYWQPDTNMNLLDMTFTTIGRDYTTSTQLAKNKIDVKRDSIIENVFIDSTTKDVEFILSWENGEFNLQLETPNNDIINKSIVYTNPDVYFFNASNYQSFLIKNPLAGKWNITVIEIDAPLNANCSVHVLADTNKSLSIETNNISFDKYENVTIYASLYDSNTPITNATVIAYINNSYTIDQIILYDDGDHNDFYENDGFYANKYSNTIYDEEYTIYIEANGTFSEEEFNILSDEKIIYVFFQNPNAILDEFYIGSSNNPITFNASESYDPDGAIILYYWDFGDDTNGSGEQINHAYNETGSYNVTLTVVDDDGLNSTRISKADIDIPQVEIIYPEIYSIVSKTVPILWYTSTSTFKDALSINIYYSDDFENWTALVEDTENDGLFDWNTTMVSDGFYVLKIEAIDNELIGFSYSNLFSIGQPPNQPTGPSDGVTYIDYSFQTNKTDINNDQIYYQWNWDDGNVSDWLGPYDSGTPCFASHNWSRFGDYNISVRAKNATLNFTSDWSNVHTIIIIASPNADFIYSPFNPNIGDIINFTDNSKDDDGFLVNWSWDFDDGNISYLQNPTHQYIIAGNYSVNLTVTDDDGETDSVSKSITVIDGTPPIITNVTINVSDPLDTAIGWENFTCTVTDNTEVDKVKLILVGDTTAEYPMIKDGDDYYLNVTISTADEYTYHIWANDTSDNYAESASDTFELPLNADVNEDGSVGFVDIMMVAGKWGATGPNGWDRADVDNSGEVGFVDIMMVAGMWGQEW